MKHTFRPVEIIFASSNECNLHCKHCFIDRSKSQISASDAILLIESAVAEGGGQLERVGFSGGEPFLHTEFIVEVCKAVLDNDLLFDRIMTNGDWWANENFLRQRLSQVYDAGYDGKIGLSFDSFHNQTPERIATFIKTVFDIWNDGEMIEIQSVVDTDDTFFQKLQKVAELLDAQILGVENLVNDIGGFTLESDSIFIPIQRTAQSFLPTDSRSWKSSVWFRDDYCEGPGQILYIHPDGHVSPCCGFANEEKSLCIGRISDSWNTIIKNAEENEMVKLCYETGLATWRKSQEKSGTKFPGVTDDMCMFCAHVCSQGTH